MELAMAMGPFHNRGVLLEGLHAFMHDKAHGVPAAGWVRSLEGVLHRVLPPSYALPSSAGVISF